MNYREQIINALDSISFESLTQEELQQLMVIWVYLAQDYAEAIRLAIAKYPDNEGFQGLASGELHVTNLKYGDYAEAADHDAFLRHFVEKYGLFDKYPEAKAAGEKFLASTRRLSDDTRIMSVASRQSVRVDFFGDILNAAKWNLPGLPEFRYFLVMHMTSPATEAEHVGMIAEFPLKPEVLIFYSLFIKLCRTLPSLADTPHLDFEI